MLVWRSFNGLFKVCYSFSFKDQPFHCAIFRPPWLQLWPWSGGTGWALSHGPAPGIPAMDCTIYQGQRGGVCPSKLGENLTKTWPVWVKKKTKQQQPKTKSKSSCILCQRLFELLNFHVHFRGKRSLLMKHHDHFCFLPSVMRECLVLGVRKWCSFLPFKSPSSSPCCVLLYTSRVV